MHYGFLDERKGVKIILNSIDYIHSMCYDKFILIIAGKASNQKLNTYITAKINDLKNKIKIIRVDSFIDKNFTDSLFFSADYCLMPYTSVEASSGCLGHSIASNTPVIGPSKGLLGELIKEYKCGYTLLNVNDICLADMIEYAIENKFIIESNSTVLKEKSTFNFVSTLLESERCEIH